MILGIYKWGLWDRLIAFLEKNSLHCLYKEIWGIECPGCGMQRSIIALLKGDIAGSFKMFPALIPLIIFVLLCILQIIFKYKKGIIFIKYWGIICILVFIISYLLKIFTLWR